MPTAKEVARIIHTPPRGGVAQRLVACMRNRILVGLAIALLISSYASAGDTSPWTPEMQRWMTYYYKDPQPARAVEYLTPLSEALLESKGRSLSGEVDRGGLRSFYAQVFAQSNEAVRDLERAMSGLPEDIQLFARAALRRCGTAECVRVAGTSATGTDSSKRQLETSDLDDAWASFMATGDEQYVKQVVSALPLVNVRGDPSRLIVGGAAKWSLASNAYQHTRVLEICKRLIEESEPETSALLQEIVTNAESERLQNPPDEPR